jgi:hypothetical protein
MNFSLMEERKYSLTELDNMLPWEREIFISLLVKKINDENKNG